MSNTVIELAASTENIVRVERHGQFIALIEADALDLGDINTARLSTLPDREHGYRIERVVKSLLNPADYVRRPNAGLLPVLGFLAARDGRRIEVRSRGPGIVDLPEPEADWCPHLPAPCDTSLPQFVRRQYLGVVHVGSQVCLARCIAQVAVAYPNCDMTVLGARTSQLRAVARRVGGYGLHVSVHDSRNDCRIPQRIAFSTFIQSAELEIEKRPILILLDAVDATHERAQIALTTMDPQFRLFGFLRDDRKLSPSVQDILMATFGPARLDIPTHGFELSQVNVALCRIDSPQVASGCDVANLKGEGYWRHQSRNRRLANLAKAFRNSDSRRLTRLSREAARWCSNGLDRQPRVTVLADSIEHACNLASQLPGWPVVAGEDIDLSGLRYQQRRLLAERRPTWLTGNQQIVTTCAAENLRLSSPDVIIWAGGGLHRPPIPRKWLHCPAGSNHRILLIDCDDRHHVELEAWTRNRRLEYIESDWFDVGVDLTSGRIIRFLHQPNRRNR